MTILPKTVAALCVMGWTAAASAAPIDVVPGDLRIDIAPVGPALTYLEDGSGGVDLVLDPLTFGFDENGEDYYVDLFVSYGLDDPADTLDGLLSVFADPEREQLLFGGLLTGYGTVPGDIVQFLFDEDGSVSTPLASQLLVNLAFNRDLPGDDPLRNLADGARYEVVGAVQSVEIAAPVPLPSSLPLLLGAGIAVGAVGRRGRSKHRSG